MKFKYTNAQFQSDLKKIFKYLKQNLDEFDNIYGVPRGGLILAVFLSYMSSKPLVLDKNKITKKTLVVDDISDKGDTLIKVLTAKDCYKVITLFSAPRTKFPPSYFCREKNPEDWVVFPWETNESSKYNETSLDY